MDKFISIPLKTTYEIDLTKSFKKSIDSNYSGLSKLVTNQTLNGIAELNKMRSRVCTQTLPKDLASLEMLMRYYDQLSVVECKLPIPAQLPIAFKWNDAFDKGNRFRFPASLTVPDISFEQAAVLFNCAALLSSLAAVQGQENDEQLKSMARLFQQSAGAFTQLKETVVKMLQQQNPTTDLLPDSLTAFSSLMLAQAQEAIYIKAAKDSLKPTALVKIAQQLAEFYQQTEKLFAREPVSTICDKSWQTLLAGKALLYSGLAHLHQVQSLDAEKSEMGQQLARLGEAQRLLTKAKGAVGSSLLYKENADKVAKILDKAKKENDFIYHAQVPDVKTLEELPKSSLVKPTPVQFPMSTGFVDLFESLIQEPGQKKTILEKVWRFLSPDS